ncbi:MAG: Gfo/Idh/MocA family oxidoreductase [Melioribacter sp.]|nr:Gfo/Idh/MocA family oxidoreductase [Melioribacter sp.]
MEKLKIGIIGAGRMGITHMSILGPNPNIKITAISEPSKLIGSLFEKYFSGLTVYSDYNEMIQKEELDGLLLCTPPNLHKSIGLQAIEKGINLFVEKPFTTSYKDAIELAERAECKRLVGQVGYVNRFNDMFLKAKELLKNGIVGEVIRFKTEMFSSTICKPDDGEGWRGKIESGGGCLFEMGSHAIDLVNYLIGIPDKISGSLLNKVYSKNVEDIVSSSFYYNNGIVGTLFVNWCDPTYRKPSNKIEIFGSEGKMLVSQHELKIFLKSLRSDYKLSKGWNTIYITDIFNNVPFYVRGNEFTSQLFHFVDNIIDRSKTNICTFADGANTQRVIEEIRADAKINMGSN